MPEPSKISFDKDLAWSGLKGDERKLQESILEIVVTEQNYLGRMGTIKEVFVRPSEMVLCATERTTIFQNVDELVEASQVLVERLLTRRSEINFTTDAISDLFIEFIESYGRVFTNYCIGHSKAGRQLAMSLASNKKFAKVVQDGLRLDRCSGLEFDSFLLEPVQRLARYPLLLRQVLHYTDPTNNEHRRLQKALQVAEGLLHQTNEAVREAENRAKLVEIQSRLLKSEGSKRWSLFGSRRTASNQIELDLTGETRELGPRVLMHEGSIWIDKKQYEAFLFNDFLLLCQLRSKGTLQVYKILPLRDYQLILSDSKCTLVLNEERIELSLGEWEEVWKDELRKTHQQASSKQPFKPIIPALQHYIGSMQLSIISASYMTPLGPSNVAAELGYQKVQTNSSKLLWNESFIISVADLQDDLRLTLSLPGNALSPAKVLGSAKLPLDILEYQQSAKTDLSLANGNSVVGSVSIQILYKPFAN